MLKSLAAKLRGMPVKNAINRLQLVEIKAAKQLSLCIESALANAQKNKKLDSAILRIKSIEIQKGPFFKRWQPVSRGMAHQIQKRTTHIKVALTEMINKKALVKKELNKEKSVSVSENKLKKVKK